ncbi:MAG: xanthine dehydrogenase family protein molybdopterin-binding subunit [Ardenticatenaceae bacterium]|nr:xanthine dehydrogenase family protein molybdopterin-binding subunit [Ardenticatenaceae bacterium]MCB8974786.1 xanthine dehydrogenase family protein molybdopterin-binding subunit [Ardenticatenaceae bacterium]
MTSNQPPKSNVKKWRVSRRGFLIGLGATVAAVAVGVPVGLPRARLAIANLVAEGGSFGSIDAPPTSWFEITADNRIRFFNPKVEMGQGVHTSLAQIAAEELEVDWEQIEVVSASTARGINDSMGTGNSTSVSSTFTPIREAAATLRELLRTEAANLLGVPAASLSVASGVFTANDDPGKAITYGEIVAQADVASWEIPEEAPALKPASEFRFVGKSTPRVDFESKLTGKALYGYDMRLPNMLYGAVARPSTIEGKLKSATPGEAPNRPGVVAVVAEDDFAGVAAESRLQAYAGVGNMVLEWEDGRLWQQSEIDELVTVGNGTRVVAQKDGDIGNLLDGDVLTAEFRTPLAAHAHLEPHAALVDVQADKVTVWASTQAAFVVRGDVAEALGIEEELVEVIPTFLGGGFGHKSNVPAAREAALLSRAAGRPVHVGWNRTEEMRHGFFRPSTHHVLTGKVDGNGRIQALQHEVASGDVLFSFFPGIASAIVGADFGAYRGARLEYDGIPNRQMVSYRTPLPVRTGPWRGLGLLANTFAIESFMDEMAQAANIDPLQFRLNHLTDSTLSRRFRNALETVAEMANWGGSLPEGHALGLAINLDAQTVVAQIADVSVENDQIRVHNVYCTMDPGLVINPDGATAQAQGSIVMGLSSTFFEEITVKDGAIEAANFDGYPLLTMKETPDIHVQLLESSSEPTGVGEPPIGPIAAAVGNAVFALTGQRLTRLPMRLGN